MEGGGCVSEGWLVMWREIGKGRGEGGRTTYHVSVGPRGPL